MWYLLFPLLRAGRLPQRAGGPHLELEARVWVAASKGWQGQEDDPEPLTALTVGRKERTCMLTHACTHTCTAALCKLSSILSRAGSAFLSPSSVGGAHAHGLLHLLCRPLALTSLHP